MHSPTYVARTPTAFSALLQTSEIGGLPLQPFAPIAVRDEFFDTPTGDLLQEGLVLRVREQGGTRTAALRRLRPDPDGRPLPADVRFEAGHENRLVPPGPLAEAVRERVGSAPLGRVLALRQNRTARVAMDDERAVALFSFDVVVYDLPEPYVSNEVEVEPLGDATEAHGQRIHDDLVARGLAPEAASKFERGLVRLPRSLREAVLLTPSERDALEAAARLASPLIQRRARVVLLDARGLRPDTIAAQTGLGMARVKHWRLRFREERLGILNDDVAEATPASASSVPAASGRPGASDWPPAPRPEASPVPEAAARREAVFEPVSRADTHTVAPAEAPAPAPSGDGASPPEQDLPQRDISDLLDLFSPGDTGTPLLDESGDDALLPEAEDDDASAPEPPAPPTATAPPPRVAFPVVLGPVPIPPVRARREIQADDRPTKAPTSPPRRPVLTGETPLLEAAQATLAYHVAAFETAVERFTVGGEMAEARRLLIAVHRVRLGAETFRRLLPEEAVARLLAVLRPLAADLDAALDAQRAADQAVPEARGLLDVRRQAAVAAAQARLGTDRHRTWGARARRLLDRLAAQHADGLLLGDDVPPPPDDFVGEPGDVPAPSRLRHIIASLLWMRYEAVRAFEADLRRAGPVSSDLAYHFAIAVSALHFALGMAQASGGPVREVAEVLERAEKDAIRLRNEQRTAELLAEVRGGAPPEAAAAPLLDIWRPLASPAFRARLAAISARV